MLEEKDILTLSIKLYFKSISFQSQYHGHSIKLPTVSYSHLERPLENGNRQEKFSPISK